MALKQEAEQVRDKADRVVSIIQFAQKATVQYNENPDLELQLTAAIRQQLQAKVAALQAEIKAIAAGW